MHKNTKMLAVLSVGTILVAQSGVNHPVLASSFPQYSTNIFMNGKKITSPVHIVANDTSSNKPTSWLPIYYLIATLKQIGVGSSWSGSVWNMSVPQSFNVDLSGLPMTRTVSAGQMAIAINGHIVAYAPKISAADPSGGAITSFAPIYYVEVAMKRMNIVPQWDGTNWTMSSSVVVSETQMAMANSMWQVFNATTWDVDKHPAMMDAGVSPTSGTVTGGDVSTWLADWAIKAKGLTSTWGPLNGQYVPFSLAYEVSQDPYTWASINDLFQNTDVTSSSSIVNPIDAQTILSNLQWWLNGAKQVNGTYYLHAPFYSNYPTWLSNVPKMMTQAQYESVWKETIHYFDKVTATVSGSGGTIYLTLPDTSKTANSIAWSIVDGTWQDGRWDKASRLFGGKTLVVPNNGPGLGVITASLSQNLLGYQTLFVNQNGKPVFKPYDIGNGQNP